MQTLALVCMSIQNVDYGIIYCKFYTNWFHGTLWEICDGLVFWIIMLQPFLCDINLCQGQSHLATWSMCRKCSVLSVSSLHCHLCCHVLSCQPHVMLSFSHKWQHGPIMTTGTNYSSTARATYLHIFYRWWASQLNQGKVGSTFSSFNYRHLFWFE